MTEYQTPTYILIAGVDEVGRGALFGPVVAAAVILSEDGMTQLTSAGVKDSKKLTPRVRSQLATEIKAIAIDCKIGWASVKEIDRFNILQATLLAMKRAISRLNPQPELCLIDGNQKIPQLLIPQQTIIKGDSTSIVIAAASIVAKVWRDELIIRLSKKYPEYDLKQNKGYGTEKHRQAIQEYGITCQHRQSFGCCQLSLLL
ncbi:ribonuclease HII [Planktothrix paucivesiculata]|uniref:Ribonuclease HII n=1 Tax=Planktothrix paucivesiculata PCC 9631 TaxID=671071 RepID=A0A7Z9BLQ5_9CYAN|nr:ribonuclease HII [Planktothrix paucivesiculata]VXD11016.1 Ribonuclease HII [Planktothrix paucivesiculata PCC 9631]